MQEEQKQGPRRLTMDFLIRIKKLTNSQKEQIEAIEIEPEGMHQAVFSSVANILELIRKGMSDEDFNLALKARPGNPHQTVSIT